MSKIKTFRGLLPDGGQDRLRLTHKDGKTGYRIKKFQIISNNPTGANTESVVEVWSIKQTALNVLIDFSEQTLLAASFFSNASAPPNRTTEIIIFDSVVFNQDIFVTVKGGTSADSMNYYLELEQDDLDDNEATATILKNFRNTNSSS